MKPSHLFTHGWQALGALVVIWFGLEEGYALASGHPENTLSRNLWRFLQVVAHEHLSQHPAQWVLCLGVWLTVVTFITGHIFFGWWR